MACPLPRTYLHLKIHEISKAHIPECYEISDNIEGSMCGKPFFLGLCNLSEMSGLNLVEIITKILIKNPNLRLSL